MARMQAGLMGPLAGKIGGAVCASWKDVNYARSYAKPGNPNTVLQAAQRAKFAACGRFAKGLIGQVFNQYTDKFLRSMSGYNKFMADNTQHFGVVPTWASVRMTEGPLYGLGSASIVADDSDNTIVATFPTTVGNNGAATDKVYGVAYNPNTGEYAFPVAEVDRSTGTITIPMAVTAGDTIHVWLWASQYVSLILNRISFSSYATAIAVA